MVLVSVLITWLHLSKDSSKVNTGTQGQRDEQEQMKKDV